SNIPHRIAWIEQKPNRSQVLQSVPERIGLLLGELLFKRFPTTLLIPQGSGAMLPEILPPNQNPNGGAVREPPLHGMLISLKPQPTLEDILTNPPPGKTVILLPGKSAIEDLYVKHAEA